MKYTRNEISFRHKRNLFTLLFIADEMNYNFVLGVVRVNHPIKYVNKPEQNIETSMLEATIHSFIDEMLY